MLREAILGALVGVLTGLALRMRRPVTVDTEEYEDYSTDVYLLDLSTSVGPLLIESRLPFLGSEWGQYERTDDDD